MNFVLNEDTLSRRHEALLHSGTRDSVSILAILDATISVFAASVTLSLPHETIYHGGTRDSISAAGETVARRYERL